MLSNMSTQQTVVLQYAKLQPSDEQEVFLIGGGTRSALVKTLITSMFKFKKIVHLQDDIVAQECAVHGEILNGKIVNLVVNGVGSNSLDICCNENLTWRVISKSTRLPHERELP
jgi:molecular chaperone DnaK (HSP70)